MSDNDSQKPIVLEKAHETVQVKNAAEAGAHLGVVPSAVLMLIQTGRVYNGWSAKFDKAAAESES